MALREILIEFGIEVDPNSEKKVNKTLQGVKSLAKSVGLALGAAAIGKGFLTLTELASDANETTSQLNQTFGELADGVRDFAETTAREVGRSEFELRKFAASTGAIVKPLLGSGQAAEGVATDFAKLAVDLGSFFNATDDEALRALQSGILGQSEPLRKFGVVLSVATLQSFALSQGITTSVQKMTEAEKATLRYQFIMQQTADAQGDAARTSKGFANASKALQSRLVDLGTRIGSTLLPGVESTLQSLIGLADATAEWVKANKELIAVNVERVFDVISGVLQGLGTIIKAIAKQFENVTSEMTDLEAALFKVGIGFLVLVALLGLPATLILGISTVIALLIEDFIKMGKGGESATGTLINGFQEVIDRTGGIGPAISEALSVAFDFFSGFFKDVFGLSDETIKNISTTLRNSFKDTIDLWTGLVDDFFNFFSKGADKITDTFVSIGEAIGLGDKVSEDEVIDVATFGGITRKIAEQGAITGVPASLAAPGGVGAGTVLDQSRVEMSVQVDASGNAQPQEVGRQVQQGVSQALESRRQTKLDFAVQVAGG